MKRIVTLILAFVLLLGMVSCGSSKQEAFEISQKAFKKIDKAYNMVNKVSEDIYEAWRLGINEESKINNDNELGYFAGELHLKKDDLKNAIGKLLGNSYYESSNTYFYYESGNYGDWYDLGCSYDSFFSACVTVVSEAYKINGTMEKIEELLEESKKMMKQLGDGYSDYEHYPNLKEYFTTTSAFFGFCQEPEGSFEQVVETFNDYRNEARDYYYDLSYVFVESDTTAKKEEE